MNEIISTSASRSTLITSTLIPLPELPIIVRLGTNDDLTFVDELQKKNNKSLGFMNRPTLEGKIKREEVLIAEEVASGQLPVDSAEGNARSGLATNHWPLATRVGYLIGNDRYFKRDELGAIFQLCVVPGRRRGLVGATLLKSLFERASYGTKLYCCWCAQDLEANHFWEAMGFVPVAFRTGSRNKNKRQDGQKGARIHIFWQKRIRAGDRETPYWYPHETNGGSIGEDRLVLPIDPRIHWSEVKLEVLPGEENVDRGLLNVEADGVCESAGEKLLQSTIDTPQSKQKPKRIKKVVPVVTPSSSIKVTTTNFGSRLAEQRKAEAASKPKREKSKREETPKVKQKNDPAKVKAARYIRDRYMEEINRGDHLVSHGKYDVSRLAENAPVPVGKLTGQARVLPDQKLLEVLPVEVKRAA